LASLSSRSARNRGMPQMIIGRSLREVELAD
jgi:hypothetical protein